MELWGSIRGNTSSDKPLELKGVWMLGQVVSQMGKYGFKCWPFNTQNWKYWPWNAVLVISVPSYGQKMIRGPTQVSHVPKHCLRRTVAGEIFQMLTTLPGTFLLPPQNSITPEWKNKCVISWTIRQSRHSHFINVSSSVCQTQHKSQQRKVFHEGMWTDLMH